MTEADERAKYEYVVDKAYISSTWYAAAGVVWRDFDPDYFDHDERGVLRAVYLSPRGDA